MTHTSSEIQEVEQEVEEGNWVSRMGGQSQQSPAFRLQVVEFRLPQVKHEEVSKHGYHLPVEELSPTPLLQSHCASPERGGS